LQQSGREEAGLPAGEILVSKRLGAAAAGSSVRETCRGGHAGPTRKQAHGSHRSTRTCRQRGLNLGHPESCAGQEARPTLDGDNRDPWIDADQGALVEADVHLQAS